MNKGLFILPLTSALSPQTSDILLLYLKRLLSVSVKVIADVNPIRALLVLLPDELVKVHVGLYPVKEFLAVGDVTLDVDVSGLTRHVLAVRDSTH